MTTSLTLGEIAARYGCELRGDPDACVQHVATLSSADAAAISFLANPSYRSQLESTGAAAVILTAEDADACPVAALVTSHPYTVYAHIATVLHPPQTLMPGIHAKSSIGTDCLIPDSCQVAAGAVIEDGASLGERVSIGPGSVVGQGASLGDDTRLLANVAIYHGVRIGARCLVHSGAVIGSDGFGHAQSDTGWVKVPQVGSVTLGDDVEVGANTTIDRGAIEDTVIADDVKLDNQIQIAHNVTIGAHTAIAAKVGIAGSTTIGSACMIGGSSIISGHITICDHVMLAAGTGVANNIDKPGAYGGYPANADDIVRWRKNVVRYGQLDDMARRLRRLEKQLDKISTND